MVPGLGCLPKTGHFSKRASQIATLLPFQLSTRFAEFASVSKDTKTYNLAGRATGKTHCLRSSATIPGGAEAGRTLFTPTRDHRATEGDKRLS